MLFADPEKLPVVTNELETLTLVEVESRLTSNPRLSLKIELRIRAEAGPETEMPCRP